MRNARIHLHDAAGRAMRNARIQLHANAGLDDDAVRVVAHCFARPAGDAAVERCDILSPQALVVAIPMTDRDKSPPGAVAALRQWIDVVAAPVGLVAAVLLYFGWVRTRAYFDYFGVPVRQLGLSPQDYVLLSIDSAFGIMVRLMAIAVAMVIADRVVSRLIRRPRGPWSVGVRWGLVVLGASLFLVGTAAALGHQVIDVPPVYAAGALAVGALLAARFPADAVASAVPAAVLRTLVAVSVLVALLWGTTLYAQELGVRQARAADVDQAGLPYVVLFSREAIDLPGVLVTTSAVTGADGKPSYRYAGMRLLTSTGDRWFLVTGRFDQRFHSSVTVVRDAPEIRVEIARPR